MARLSADSPVIHPDCQITDTRFGRLTVEQTIVVKLTLK